MALSRKLALRSAIFAVAVVWALARVAFWNGFYTEDAPGYVTDAIYAATGTYHARTYVNGLNVGTYLPVAIPIKLLGKSEAALSVWPLMSSALGVASVGAMAGILFGGTLGVIAALLYATYPGDVFFSTVVMPDSIQAGWLSFSMCLIVVAMSGRRMTLHGGGRGGRGSEILHEKSSSSMSTGSSVVESLLLHRVRDDRMVVLALAGIAMGVCHLIRANDVLLLPVGVAAVVLFSRIWRRDPLPAVARSVLAYGCGWLVVVLLEGAAYMWAAGDFLLRLHAVSRHYGGTDSISRWGLNIDPTTIPFSIFAPIMWWIRGGWGSLNQDQAYHGLLFCWALIASAAGLVILSVRRNRVDDRAAAGFLAGVLWAAWPLVYHQFGSQSLTAFVPMHRLSRHLVVDAPGAVFATVAGAYLIWNLAAGARPGTNELQSAQRDLEPQRTRKGPEPQRAPRAQRTRRGFVSFVSFVVQKFRVVRETISRPGSSARAALAIVVAAAFVVHVYINWKGERIAYNSYQRIKSTYVRLRGHLPQGVRTIIADPGDLCYFDFWLNPAGVERVRMMPFANYSNCAELRDGVVLTESNRGWEPPGAPIIQETVKRLPCLTDPPVTWQLVYQGQPERMYMIGAASR